MADFRVVLIEHGYRTIEYEREIVTRAGGEFVDAEAFPPSDLPEVCRMADAIMVRRLAITRQWIAGLRRCRIILRYGVGVDNVDLQAATDAGIMVGHVPGYCADEVAVHAIGLFLACVRRIVSTDTRLRGGAWDVHRNEPIYRVAGRTFGLVGLGNIGRNVARKLAGWDLKLLAFDPYAKAQTAAELGVKLVEFPALLGASDFVSLHCPLLPETRHLMNDAAFARMKEGAILVNTARGPVVETGALVRGLDSGRLAAAALDVFESEPLPRDSILRRHARVVLSDHTAWYSEESQIELQKTAAEEVVRVCRGGLPRNIANPEVLRALGRSDEWQLPENARWQLERLAGLSQQGRVPGGG